MSINNLHEELKHCIYSFLTPKDHVFLVNSSKLNPKFNSLSSSLFWKKIFLDFYPSQRSEKLEKDWKLEVKAIFQQLKNKNKFTDKFKACIQLKCEKLGLLPNEKINKTVLTICLKDLISNPNVEKKIKLSLAEDLLKLGADPLLETNCFLEDAPLQVAVLKNEHEIVSLILKHVPKTKETINWVGCLIDKIHKNNNNFDTTILEKFLQ